VSTFRTDLVAHLMTVANTYRAANPTLLRRVWSARPGSFGEVPCVYVGRRDEDSPDDDTGTYTRNISVEVIAVDVFGDNEQTTDRMDVLVDPLTSAYRSAWSASVAGGIIDRVGLVLDGEIAVTNPTTNVTTYYRSATLTVAAHVQEGRT